MDRIILFFILFFVSANLCAQQSVSGVVRDASSTEGLVGAIVIVDDGKLYHTNADVYGNYNLLLPDGNYILKVRYPGYATDSLKLKIAGKSIIHNFNCSSKTLKEVEIISDVALDRKTPVAFSNINENKIREEVGGRDITMLLNSTPGAYASEQGGGAGDSRVNIRGVDQRNVGVMVDGVPMNDMENGQVYWSNWSGLSDVTRTMQVQRGLGASKLAIPSVGGTINILTRGIDGKRSVVFRSDVGNNSLQKISFMFNSGEIGKGWGITFAGARRTANGWADQTWDDQWAYFLKIQKRFNKNLFSLSINGAPQSHGQRFTRMSAAIYDRSYGEKIGINVDSVYASNNGYTTTTQGERGLRYNSSWGDLATSTNQANRLSQNLNYYNKPLFNLSWYYFPSEKLNISTVAYVSIGNGGGTNYSGSVTRDTLTGQQNIETIFNSNSTTIDALYSSTEYKASRVLLSSMNNHIWGGALSTATYKPNNHLAYLLGIDLRYYKGSHYRTVYDLIGGDYYVEPTVSNQSQPRGTFIGDPNFQFYKKNVGDKVGYWNESYVNWGGLFGQVEYSKNKWSAFLTTSGSLSQYQRVDHFKKQDIVLSDTVINMIVGYNETYYTNGTQAAVAQNGAVITNSGDTTIIDNPNGPTYQIANATGYGWNTSASRTAQTEKKIFKGYTIKTGVNYNIGDNYRVFVNIGYLKMAPRFNTVFDNNNRPYPITKYQIVYAGELGFGARFQKFAINLNTYYTIWKNKPPAFSPTINIAGDIFTYDLLGLNTNFKGIELDGTYKFGKKLSMEGVLSLGEWKYNSAEKVFLYDANYDLIDTIEYSAINIHVGDAAQTQVSGALRWEPIKGFYLKPRYTFFTRHFSNFDPIALSEVKDFNGNVVADNRNRDSWQMPSYGLLDIFTGYELKEPFTKEKNKIISVGFTLSVTNVLNSKYISDGQNGSDFNASTALVYMGMGRRWNAGMRISF